MENIAKIALALSKAQLKIHGAKKDSQNPYFSSSYADLASVMDAIRVPFADNELSYTQPVVVVDKVPYVKTILMHSSGEYIDSLYPIVAKDMTDPQKVGSAVTYARRYALAAIAGVAQIDDDANMASNVVVEKKPLPNHAPQAANPANLAKNGKKVTEAQLKRLDAIAHKSKWDFGSLAQHCKDKYGCLTSELNMIQYDELCTYIQANKPKEEGLPF